MPRHETNAQCAALRVPRVIACLLFGMALFTAGSASAADDIEQVLRTLASAEPAQFAYREARTMALLEQVWTTQGELYVSPGQMIVAQHTPKETLTWLTGDSVEHVDFTSGRRFSRSITDSDRLNETAALLMLFSPDADRDALHDRFAIRLQTLDRSRRLILTPKGTQGDIRDITITLDDAQHSNRMLLDYWDGDSSEWRLQPTNRGAAVEAAMQDLIKRIQNYAPQ